MPPSAPRKPSILDQDSPVARAALDRSLVKREGLYRFVQLAWETVYPGVALITNWHLKLICDHLEAVSRGEISQLLINVPPGFSKSSIVSVMWPAWDWISHHSRKWIVSTFDDDLKGRDALACRALINSDWYQSRWGREVNVLDTDDTQGTQGVWSTTGGGRRKSVTVRGGVTGWHGNIILVDDPLKPEDMAEDPEVARAALERVWTWWRRTMASRLLPGGARVIIMQRLHESDLVGKLLEEEAADWTTVILPMEFEPDRACVTRWGKDPRTEPGELLCPAYRSAVEVDRLKRTMGSQVAAAQLQQRPAPAGGNVFKRVWFDKRWMREDNPKWKLIPTADRDRYVVLPRFFTGAISVDCTFKDVAGADNVALEAWGESGSRYFLLDCIADRMDINATERCLEALSVRWPFCRAKLIEDKANGPAIEQRLRKRLSGIIMVNPEGGKVGRANAMTPLCEAENIILPDESEADWIGPFVEEVVTFPFARRDDRVDAMTQAITHMYARNMGRYLEAMANVAAGRVHIREAEDSA